MRQVQGLYDERSIGTMQNGWPQIGDWTAAYDNRAAVPCHEEHFYGWGRDAAAYRASHAPQTVTYGESDREIVDLFMPKIAPAGLMIFIHGGWWMYFGREYFSHMAAGAVAHGWAVAVPSYTLCPDIRIAGIVPQLVRAVERACAEVPGIPVTLCGHSAGGHLVSMLGTEECGLSPNAATRIERLVAISGIADLHPILRTEKARELNLDADEARSFSPLLLTPRSGFDCVAWCGADELAEFRRQTALLATGWGGIVAMRHQEAKDRDHFTVIAPLAEADSDLTRTAILHQSG